MAISLVGGSAALGTGSTTITVAYPAGMLYGDLVILPVVNKYPTNGPTTPAGWTLLNPFRFTGGSGGAGADSGTVYISAYVKVAEGGETGSISISIPSGNSSCSIMHAYRKTASGVWSVAVAGGSDNSAGVGWSVTAATDPGIRQGDVVTVWSGSRTDAGTFSAQAISAAGCGFGASLFNGDGLCNVGDQCALHLSSFPCTSGSSTAAPVFTATSSSALSAGATLFLRIRESEAPSYSLSPGSLGDGGRGVPRRPR